MLNFQLFKKHKKILKKGRLPQRRYKQILNLTSEKHQYTSLTSQKIPRLFRNVTYRTFSLYFGFWLPRNLLYNTLSILKKSHRQ